MIGKKRTKQKLKFKQITKKIRKFSKLLTIKTKLLEILLKDLQKI